VPGQHEDEELRLTHLRIAALDALGREGEAPTLRWAAFERWLDVAHLRAYLGRLPDFDDVDAEHRAMALSFPVGWPNLEAANPLVRDHHGQLDGRDYGRLRPAAERYPAAATLLHRVLAEDVLQRASSPQYQYAARDVRSCTGLASFVPGEAGLETHDDSMASLRRDHPRKSGCWSLLSPATKRGRAGQQSRRGALLDLNTWHRPAWQQCASTRKQ